MLSRRAATVASARLDGWTSVAFGAWRSAQSVRCSAIDSAMRQLNGHNFSYTRSVQAALEQNVPAPVITLALQMRIASRQEDSFSAKVQAALRNEFGGHAVKKG